MPMDYSFQVILNFYKPFTETCTQDQLAEELFIHLKPIWISWGDDNAGLQPDKIKQFISELLEGKCSSTDQYMGRKDLIQVFQSLASTFPKLEFNTEFSKSDSGFARRDIFANGKQQYTQSQVMMWASKVAIVSNDDEHHQQVLQCNNNNQLPDIEQVD